MSYINDTMYRRFLETEQMASSIPLRSSRQSSTKGYEYCSETDRYEHKDRLVKVNYRNRLIRRGKGDIGFFLFDKKGHYYVCTVDLRDDNKVLSSHIFNFHISWKEAKKILFGDTEHIRTYRRRVNMPFKVIVRHIIISEEKFKELFEENTYTVTGYHYNSNDKDSAIDSLEKILLDSKPVELSSGSHSSSIARAIKHIRHERRVYQGDFPCVSIFAVWSNFNAGTKLIKLKDIDSGSPLFFTYDAFSSREDIKKCLT